MHVKNKFALEILVETKHFKVTEIHDTINVLAWGGFSHCRSRVNVQNVLGMFYGLLN